MSKHNSGAHTPGTIPRGRFPCPYQSKSCPSRGLRHDVWGRRRGANHFERDVLTTRYLQSRVAGGCTSSARQYYSYCGCSSYFIISSGKEASLSRLEHSLLLFYCRTSTPLPLLRAHFDLSPPTGKTSLDRLWSSRLRSIFTFVFTISCYYKATTNTYIAICLSQKSEIRKFSVHSCHGARRSPASLQQQDALKANKLQPQRSAGTL